MGKIHEKSDRVIGEVEKAVIGKNGVLKRMFAAFLVPGGHILLEDFPGLAKTLIAGSFSRAMGLDFKRIQFTPDLLPGDITGGYVYDSNQGKFSLRKGPIFTNILLADEINRASPKTQSALLEAMQEHQVTLEGETFPLPEPFLVIATQNPIEYEGTFPLPEAQLDRFLMRLSVGYPSEDEEREILFRRLERRSEQPELQPVINREVLLELSKDVEEVHVDRDVVHYITDLCRRSRSYSKVVVGASPRGSLAMLKLARAWAAMAGRDYVVPDDVKEFAVPVLSHRLVLDSNLWGNRGADDRIVGELLKTVAVPL
ncbi:MAG: MoxR family ATPase, partial [Spirochaetales bacterium]|nr:MoxR family ATPase [Spirochaetales bacterium]